MDAETYPANDVVERVLSGDVRTVARLIRDIDDGIPGVRDVLKAVYPYTGRAYVIGITGAPGVGKSTLADQVINHLRKRGRTVGVLAVDPTSPFSGGAILGDRIRMQRHCTDAGVFIRSLATRGQFGGLTQSTRSAIDILDAMGKDFILVETVGVGQDEVDVVKSAHTTVIVVMPGMGDDIQAIKAGILEVGDIFVINKADHEGVDRTENHLRLMIEMADKKYEEGGWKPSIVRTQALFNKGVDTLLDEIERHGRHLKQSEGGLNTRKRESRVREELSEMVKNRLIEKVGQRLIQTGDFDRLVTEIVNGKTDPYSACDDLVFPIVKKL